MSTSDTNEVSPETTPLDAVIREYLLRIDRGEEISHKEFLASHPDLQDDLQAFFEGVALVQKMAGAPSALTETSPPTKFDTKYATVATPEGGSSDVNSKTSHSKSAADLAGPFPIMLGPYRVLKIIGQGAMGAVYVADDIRLGRKVALKVPLAAVVERPDHLDRFTREARASARLRHHNICPVYEVNEQDGVQYIAMAYIEGQPLLEVMRKNRRFTGKQIAVTIRKIAQALEVAHRAGIVHRDLKPANIMIDKDGEPIVMDFGLARQIHTADQVQLTQEGVILGTPAYMSPEQVRSELKRIGPASDIYSLGVILYELLCGSHPFRGPLMTVLMNVADKNIKPRKPSEIRGTCDPQLEAICLRMISKSIADRYPSMKDVAAALSHYIKAGQTAPEIPNTESPVNQPPAEPVAISAPTPAPTPKPELLKTESAGTSKPPRRRVGVLFGGFLAALLAGVIIITITTQEGKITEIRVPEGTKIDIPAAPGAKVSIAVSKNPAPPADNKTRSGWHGWPADAPKPAIAPFDVDQARKHQQAWAKYLKVPLEYTNSIGMKFVLIPPGEFLMGSTQEEIETATKIAAENGAWQSLIASEAPLHKTVLTRPLYIGIYEVTQGEYEKVLGQSQNPSHWGPNGAGRETALDGDRLLHPVEMVDWTESAEFCSRLSKKENRPPHYVTGGASVAFLDGEGYRLLTEAEWEYACLAGQTTVYWTGDREEDLKRAAWYGEGSAHPTHSVGQLAPNPFGLYDVHGNVWEWIEDWVDSSFYHRFPNSTAVDPVGPIGYFADVPRGSRGGAKDTVLAAGCRASYRNASGPSTRGNGLGFRVALEVDSVRKLLNITEPSIPLPAWKLHSPSRIDNTDYVAERRAAEQALSVGGIVSLRSQNGNVIEVKDAKLPDTFFTVRAANFSGSSIHDGDLNLLQDCKELETLILDRTLITGAHLSQILPAWRSLRLLSLTAAPPAGQGLELRDCPNLRELHLPLVTDEQIARILQAFPTLKALGLDGSQRVSLERLVHLKYLSSLICSGDLLTDSGISAIAAVPSLNRLTWQAPLNDDIASRVATLGTQLQSLEIVFSDDTSSSLTEVGYRDLGKSLRLIELTIRGQVPGQSVLIALTAAMPDLRSLTVQCDGSENILSPADVAEFQRRHPTINLTLGKLVVPALLSWPSGPDGAVAAWKLPEGAPSPVIAPLSPDLAQQAQVAWAKFLKLDVETRNSVDMPLRLIPPGEFIYPYPSRQLPHVGAIDERQRSLARLSKPYYLGATEVTIQQFAAFVAETGYKTTAENSEGGLLLSVATPHNFNNYDRETSWRQPGKWTPQPGDPVTQISWDDASAYCEWLSKKEGMVYRLPRETEWFHAFWAGSPLKWGFTESSEEMIKSTRFQNSIPHPLNETTSPYLTPGSGRANAFGLHEMLGNVWEWASADAFGAATKEQLEEDYSLHKSDVTLDLGGGWEAPSDILVSPWINVPNTREKRYPNLGFRILREIECAPVDGVSPKRDRLLRKRGRPLSPTAMVSLPAQIDSLRSWTIESKRHTDGVTALAHHPSADLLATGSGDNTIRIWNRQGELQKCLVGHSGVILSVHFIDQGRKLVSNAGDGEIRIWDTASGAPLVSHRLGGELPIAISPDETMIASCAVPGGIHILPVDTVMQELHIATHGCYSMAWSPDSRYLATTSTDSSICVWQVNPWKQVAKIQLDPIHSESHLLNNENLAWSKDGKTIVFHPYRGTKFYLIDGNSFKLLSAIERPIADHGLGFAWSHDGRYLALGSYSGSAILEIATGKVKCQFQYALRFLWSKDDSVVYLNSGECIDSTTGKTLQKLPWSEAPSSVPMSVSPDGRWTTTSSPAGQVSIWNAGTGELSGTWNRGPLQMPLVWSRDGKTVVVIKDGTAEFIDPVSGGVVRKFPVPTGVRAAIFSPDGRRLAISTHAEGPLRIVDSTSGQQKAALDTPGAQVDAIVWSPDSNQIMTGHNQRAELRLWSLANGELVKTYGAAASGDSDRLAESFRALSYLDWSFERPEIFSSSFFRLNLETAQSETWYAHYFLGGHAGGHSLAPNRELRLMHNQAGLTWSAKQASFEPEFLGRLGIASWWLPDSRRVWLHKGGSPPCGHDLATGRRLGTLLPATLPNIWLCIGPGGHYRSGFADQPGDGTDPKALAEIEEFLVYVAQIDDGSQVTYSPKVFREKYGWKNDPRKATLMKLNPN